MEEDVASFPALEFYLNYLEEACEDFLLAFEVYRTQGIQ